MKADLSRNTFDPARHYSAVRLQQGRILTDADWNEQADLARDHAERLAVDAIGACGGPVEGAGYALTATTHALAVAAADAGEAWVAAEDGALLHSTDGGANWTLVDAGVAAHLHALALGGGAIWVAGAGGLLLRSADGGANWDAPDAGTALALYGIAAADAGSAWAVGESGLLLELTDGGSSVALTQTDAARLYAVSVDPASGRGVAVGQGGAIVFRAAAAQSWVAAVSGSSAHLCAVARTPGGRLIAAGDAGTILFSDDGVAWSAADTPAGATLRALAMRDDSTGWAAGDGGTLLATSDGGASWSALDAGTGADLRGLAAPASGAAWVVGADATLLRVDDASPALVAAALPAVNLSLGPGRYWVHGRLCQLDAACTYANQADGGAGARLAPGVHLLYLDAWQRHVSALQDAHLREVALGGPDTATRARSMAQVRALALPAASPDTWNCASELSAWEQLLNPARPRLAARAEPQAEPASLCEIAATAGYRRLENQLYRVEVHAGGGAPAFKWSRENGSVEYAVVALTTEPADNRTIVRVAARGRDSNLDLAAGDRVELVDDHTESTARAGAMLRYTADGDDELELVLSGLPPATLGRDPARHPLLRRWDQHPADDADLLPIVEGVWTDLEEGVQIRFAPGGNYRPGDYWQIPARTITGDVEWPRGADGDALALEAAGIADAYCRIGLVDVAADGTLTVRSDCRELVPPLTAMVNLLAGGGDGQDGPPNARLPQPLQVRVHRGGLPLAGARVRFEVETGGGAVGPEGGPAAAMLDVTTAADGSASCRWTLGPGLTAPSRHQRVIARLQDADGSPVAGQALAFAATASLALHTLGGDGQQAAAGANLPAPIRARVTHGGDGVGGVTLTTAVTGGGSVTPAILTTVADGAASFAWRLGNAGAQTLTVSLNDADGNAVQRLSYGAAIASAAAGGGCEITIGPGGQFERLDQGVLAQLIQARGNALCLCFLPGTHELGPLTFNDGRGVRLAMHGCGPTAVLVAREGVRLAGFSALEMRDLTLQTAGPTGLDLLNCVDLRLCGLTLGGGAAGNDLVLNVDNAGRLLMTGCTLGSARTASLVVGSVGANCRIERNSFAGTVSFYGAPGADRTRDLIAVWANNPGAELQMGAARLHFADNEVQLLSIAAPLVEQLLARTATGLFQSAVLSGNNFASLGNVFAAGLASFSGNSFLAQTPQAGLPYGVIVCSRSTASGNLALVNDERAILHFLRPANGGHSGAANQVFTQPRSLN